MSGLFQRIRSFRKRNDSLRNLSDKEDTVQATSLRRMSSSNVLLTTSDNGDEVDGEHVQLRRTSSFDYQLPPLILINRRNVKSSYEVPLTDIQNHSGSVSMRKSSLKRDASPFSEDENKESKYKYYSLRRIRKDSVVLLGISGYHPTVSSAVSLPQINQISDYEEDPYPGGHANHYLFNNSNHLVPTDRRISRRPIQSKPKKTKSTLKRKQAIREKDGRSKSLTQIDNISDSRGMLLPRSQGGEEEECSKGSATDSAGPSNTGKLGIPEEASHRRPPLSMENRVSSSDYTDQCDESYISARCSGTCSREIQDNREIEGGADYPENQNRSFFSSDSPLVGSKASQMRGGGREESRSPIRPRVTSSRRGVRYMSALSAEDGSTFLDGFNGSPGSQENAIRTPSTRPTKPMNRWSIFQPTKDPKMDDLIKQLDLYSRIGIPRLPHLLACQSLEEEYDLSLEDSWRQLVISSEMTDKIEQQQSAIWELVETEATYICSLKVITNLFLACLCNLQNERILNEIGTDKLFNNIQDIYQANLNFWREHISLMLTETRRTGLPLNPTLMADGFYKFEELFRPYTQYCLQQTNCQLYCKENARENNHFKAYLAWCETQKECNRLKLVDILVHPMQRLTRYSILLKAILKKTDDENHKACLQDMIGQVDRFVTTVNTALRNRHEQDRLGEIVKKIESYDAVETKDDELASSVKQHCELDLYQRMPECPEHIPRWLLHRTDCKLKDAHTTKSSDVHVFLFTDLLLITKVTQRKNDKVKIIRPPYRVDRLLSVDLKDSATLGLILLSDWGVPSAAFTLQSSDQKAHKILKEALASARKQYEEAKHSRHIPIYETDDMIPSHIMRSPFVGSSRGSRVSSLAPSHSGSMELNEPSYTSPGGAHPPSVDLSEIRASSASSEDSLSCHQAEIQRSKSLEGQHPASSPRPERRGNVFLKTPNTLTVVPPYATGQSMPNLASENSLRVPTQKQLSPVSRGISYPPPSPRTLRRCPPVPQSRNPPLMKTKNVNSVMGSPQEIQTVEADTLRPDLDMEEQNKRRLSRVDRLDNRRYHTAGAIDDIKKQDTKNTSIHKRLSWNYGQGQPPPPPPRDSDDPGRLLCKHLKGSAKATSSESVHSSSGVSSTSSLLRSECENDLDNDSGDSTIVALSIADCTSLKLSPHISTTYICHESDVTLGVSTSQYITQPLDEAQPSDESLERPGGIMKMSNPSETTSVASVQITVNDTGTKKCSAIPSSGNDCFSSSSLLRSSSSSFSSGSSFTSGSSLSSTSSISGSQGQKGPQKDNSNMKEILLNDASIETSDV